MNKHMLCIAVLALSALSDKPVVFAEMYQWTDADGSRHFSDSPPANAPGKRQSILKSNHQTVKPSAPPDESSTSTPDKTTKTSEFPSSIDPACLQELKDFDKKTKTNDEAFKTCSASVMSKSRHKYSPECLKQLESKQYRFTDACNREIQEIGQAMTAELQQCAQFESRFSPKCREQLESGGRRMQEKGKICGDATQRIIRICGNGQGASEKCYKEHRAELEGACSDGK